MRKEFWPAHEVVAKMEAMPMIGDKGADYMEALDELAPWNVYVAKVDGGWNVYDLEALQHLKDFPPN